MIATPSKGFPAAFGCVCACMGGGLFLCLVDPAFCLLEFTDTGRAHGATSWAGVAHVTQLLGGRGETE